MLRTYQEPAQWMPLIEPCDRESPFRPLMIPGVLGMVVANPILLGICAALLLWLVLHAKHRRLPPGPLGWPIIGNMFDIPKQRPWEKYIQMSRQYGSDIISLKFFSTHIVVLNSARSVEALLEKRSGIYSDRPTTFMIKATCIDQIFSLTKYGDAWRARRRAFHQHFYENAVRKYDAQLHRYPKMLLKRMLEKPEDFLSHIRWMGGALILNITYGLNIVDNEDPILQRTEEALRVTNAVCGTGVFLADIFPALGLLPSFLAPFKRQAEEWRRCVLPMLEDPFKIVKNEIAAGTAPLSVTSALLGAMDEQEDKAKYEFDMQCVSGTAFAGGQDTTTSALRGFFLAMVLNPEVQNMAQVELDRVVGINRLPELADQDDLPLVTAIIYELLRWRPILPLSAYHQSITDDEFEGYEIPSGSIVIGNTWAILHNEVVYPDPDTFNPYRYLNSDGTLNTAMPSPDAVFGFGRRICPGRYFVLRSLWLVVAHILATFRISKYVDENGNVVEPSGEYRDALVTEPLPFKVDIKPRSASAEKLIRTEAFNAEA